MGPPRHYVELEHYLGPSLVSQKTMKKIDNSGFLIQTPINSAWTGMPLVQYTTKRFTSTKTDRSTVNNNYKHCLTQLAIRTHGMPLILNGGPDLDTGQWCLPYYDMSAIPNFVDFSGGDKNVSFDNLPSPSDSTSVTSDESGFSENNFPSFEVQSEKEVDYGISGGVVTLDPYYPLCYKFRNRGGEGVAGASGDKRQCTCWFCFPAVASEVKGGEEDRRRNLSGSYQPRRPWISLERVKDDKLKCVFSVMCYNVLCDRYATQQMFGYCPSWALNWDYRRKVIIDEIRHYSADVITLQEIETDQFTNFFLPELKKDGYDGIFAPKSRAKTMSEYKRKFVDGCAIFYRTSKFSLVEKFLIEFNQVAMANANGSVDMINRVMTKDDIAIAALLQTKEVGCEGGITQPILICTAHIHWDPQFCDVKLIQSMMVMHQLQKITEESSRILYNNTKPNTNNRIPLLLCGDFNSFPDSGVIEFLTSGSVPSNHADFKEFSYQKSLTRLSTTKNPNTFTHSFKMARAYSDDIMPFTNYTCDFKGIIDYIFYSKDFMNPIGLLGAFDDEWFCEQKIIGCPHPEIPSDHFSLLVQFEMYLAINPPEDIESIDVKR